MLKIEEILKLINDDASSKKKKEARTGDKYYDGKHDILNYKIYSYNGDGELQEDAFKSNIRISHAFFPELVDQQVQYMLSGDTTHIRSDDAELQGKLDRYFNRKFYSQLNELLTGTIKKGFEYLYATVDKKGHLRFRCADSLGVVEVRPEDCEEGKPQIIYWYTDRIPKGQKKIKRIQVWDDRQVTFYSSVQNGKIELDDTEPINPRPHKVFHDGKGKTFGKGFGFIPFFRLDNNNKQTSGLNVIKGLIDDYDLMACSLSNNLQDFTDAIYVVSGFKGNNLDELIANVKAKKHIGVDSDGGLDIKTVDIPYEARKAKLELDEKNIYRFGMGFNSAQLGDGNITNIVIKSRYALLDLKCNKLEARLEEFLEEILQIVLDEINEEDGTDYQIEDVNFIFDREVMTNAQDNATIEKIDAEKNQVVITTLLGLFNVLDDETIIQAICEQLDIDYEEIKDKLPKKEEEGTAAAQDLLNGVTPEGGDPIE